MKKFSLLAMIGVWTVCAATANAMTLGELQQMCSSSNNAAKEGCSYYILGIVEGAMAEANIKHDKSSFCVPTNTPIAQLQDVIKGNIKERLSKKPEDSGMLAVSFVGSVMVRDYPCTKTN